MRHLKSGRKLSRTSAHRKAMFRNMVTSLLEHEQIETTDARAKEVRRVAERMITLGKRGSLHARRLALRVVRSQEVAAKLFDELAPRYRERPGGYTRVLKTRRRVGDAAPMSLVELVDREAPVRERAGRADAPARARKAKGEGAGGEAKPRRAKPTGRAQQAAVKPTKQRPKV